jgi:regulator of sirC expression with transglutaminase-like and TPR domain
MEKRSMDDNLSGIAHAEMPMTPSFPLCCSSRAFKLLSQQLPIIDSSDALVHGAMAISLHQLEDSDLAGVDAILQKYTDTVRSRVRGRQPQAMLAHLHEVLFEEEGFAGDSEDYHNPLNSYLPAVLARKKGLPITLSLIYKTIAERLGLRSYGVGLPGHFLVGLDIDDTRLLIDPFAKGQLVSVEEAHERVQQMFGTEVEWTEEYLRPATNRHWLTRMLQNLLNVFSESSQYADVAAILEMEMLLWPEQSHLQRDLGLVLARCGLAEPASLWLDRYLRTNPDDPQKSQIRELLQVLGS